MEALFRKERYIGNAGIKNLPANDGAAGDADFIPESGRYPGGGNGGPLQHSCLENQKGLADYSPWGHKESDTT